MLYRNQNDETLVMLTLAGEQDAYEALVTRYQNAVIMSASSVTHNIFMAEDVAQDAFVTAWMKLDTLKEPKKFASWVCRIAKNCAINTVMRMRSFIPLETVDNQTSFCEAIESPEELYALSEEKEELHQSIGKLPEKIRRIIYLHYFEGLSIAEIADSMRVAEGTVKRQLHDGRKRIRKELCAMNEKWNDTFVQKVMKKVEELKLWQIQADKSGFVKVYRDVLKEVEELPESKDKYHALADVLARGFWWIDSEKNDELFARIREAAELGKNEEVMEFIVSREDSLVSDAARIEFMKDKQIPRLEKAGFTRALAREWFWLGRRYFKEGKKEEGAEAYNKVEELLPKNAAYRALVPFARECEERMEAGLKEKRKSRYAIGSDVDELRYVNGSLCYWKKEGIGKGYLHSFDDSVLHILRNSSRCDGRFFDEKLSLGESITGSDTTTLTLVSECETVNTPCGVFDNCKLWVTVRQEIGKSVYKVYYKDGVGIVKFAHTMEGVTDTRLLSSYKIVGGEGLLPLAEGNLWEYASEYDSDVMRAELKYEVAYADGETVIIRSLAEVERLSYSKDSWRDMIEEIRNEYHDEADHIRDIYPAIERAEELAKTKMEKAHTKAACSVARRILETDEKFNPGYTRTGDWNFFHKDVITQKNGIVSLDYNSRWSFEWKGGVFNSAEYPLLFNDVYGILQDATNCIWSDEWIAGAEPILEYTLWDNPMRTKIVCSECDRIETAAGVFENCLHVSLDISGYGAGHSYRGGKKDYYFSKGVGIVRAEHEFCEGAKRATYDLTYYEGKGEGYMPMCDGLVRRYQAIGLTDGYIGEAEYTYVEDDDGQIYIFTDRTGVRELPPPITSYTSIESEMVEERLWNEKKREESRLRHDINNLNILLHFLGRPSRNWAAARKATEWHKYQIKIIEFLAEGGDIPRAWWGAYYELHFRAACSLFGCRTDESKAEGYEYLEKAFELYQRWADIPDGEPLEIGNEWIFGGVKLIKGKGLIELPDGTREVLEDSRYFNVSAKLMHYGMTAKRGWEWFNPVRDEERFKKYIERAHELIKK